MSIVQKGIMINVKKMKKHTCRGCINDGFPVSICRETNELMKKDCGTDKLIYVIKGGWSDEEPTRTDTREIFSSTERV